MFCGDGAPAPARARSLIRFVLRDVCAMPVCSCHAPEPYAVLALHACRKSGNNIGDTTNAAINFHWANKRCRRRRRPASRGTSAAQHWPRHVNCLSTVEREAPTSIGYNDRNCLASASLGSHRPRRHYGDHEGQLNYTWGVTALACLAARGKPRSNGF